MDGGGSDKIMSVPHHFINFLLGGGGERGWHEKGAGEAE